MKYTFTLLDSSDSSLRAKRVLESRGDLPRHVALKLVAYVLWRKEAPELRIEQSVGQRHKPDLVSTDPVTEAVLLWIDCGQIETKRLGRIAAKNPGARIIVLKGSQHEAQSYARVARQDLPQPCRARVEIWGLDESFTDSFVAGLRGANTLTVRRDEDQLTLEGSTAGPLQTALHVDVLATGSETA